MINPLMNQPDRTVEIELLALDLSLSGAKSRVQRGRQKLKDRLLACCQVQFDTRGNILDYQLKETQCRRVNPQSSSVASEL
jgi:hypothetical protein